MIKGCQADRPFCVGCVLGSGPHASFDDLFLQHDRRSRPRILLLTLPMIMGESRDSRDRFPSSHEATVHNWDYFLVDGVFLESWRFHSETRTHLLMACRLLIWKVSPKQPQRRGGYPSARSQNATFRQPLAALTDNLADLLRASCRLILNNPT